MRERRNSLRHLYNVLIWFVLNLLGFLLPGSSSCCQNSIDSRSEIRDSTSGGNSCSSEGYEMFAFDDEFSKSIDLLVEFLLSVEVFELVLVLFMSCVGHLFEFIMVESRGSDLTSSKLIISDQFWPNSLIK